jgi:hypothetical protein
MSAYNSGEFGYAGRDLYLKGSEIYKMRYREHFGKEKEFYEQYGHLENPDYSKMKYADTLYTFIMYKKAKMHKTSGSKFIKVNFDKQLMYSLISCGIRMREEILSDEVRLENK